MNASGDLVGFYCPDLACNTFHAFLLSKKGQFTSFDPPGALGSAAATINPSGAICGWYNTNSPPTLNGQHGYLLYKGKFATIDFPGAGNFGSFCGANNPEGDIVGGYNDSSGAAHGFLLSHGVFTSFDYPGAAGT